MKSAIGLGWLLSQGIGDTLRVSLAADPVEEVKGRLRNPEVAGIASSRDQCHRCPTCGRVQKSMVRMANELEKNLDISDPLNVSVLGCVVNGIGEGKGSGYPGAGGEGKGILFKGKLMRKVPMDELMDTPHSLKSNSWPKKKKLKLPVSRTNGSSDGQTEEGWELMGHAPDEHSTIVRDIPSASQ